MTKKSPAATEFPEYEDVILIIGDKRITLTPIATVQYSNGTVVSGLTDDPEDNIYIQLHKDDVETTILLREDEANAHCMVLNAALLSKRMTELEEKYARQKASQQQGLPTNQKGQD